MDYFQRRVRDWCEDEEGMLAEELAMEDERVTDEVVSVASVEHSLADRETDHVLPAFAGMSPSVRVRLRVLVPRGQKERLRVMVVNVRKIRLKVVVARTR